MSPYRGLQPAPWSGRRSPRWTVRRKFAGILLFAFALRATGFTWPSTWAFALTAASIVIGLVLALSGRSRTPLTRLCALQWNRGDRFGAALLFFNVVAPRYSAKRISRNETALENAQVGMFKPRWFAFHFVDYDE